MFKYLILSFLSMLILSCSTFVDRVHQQISSEEDGSIERKMASSGTPYPAQAYGKLKSKLKDKYTIKDPISYTLTGEENNTEVQKTPLKVQKRFNVADFVDTDPSGSLWNNYDDSSSFFATSNSRRVGDIVVIDVLESMKNSISKELRKTFPLPSILQSNSIVNTLNEENEESGEGQENRSPASAPAAATDEKKEDNEVVEIVYDKISSRVSYEPNKDHVLLKGRKEVYFRNKKRLVEVHALVKKSDIDSNDHIKSDQFIESKVFILQ